MYTTHLIYHTNIRQTRESTKVVLKNVSYLEVI